MPATLLDTVTPAMRIFAEETFGHVTAIVRVNGDEEAVACANNSAFGFSAANFTQDFARGWRVANGSSQAFAISTVLRYTTRRKRHSVESREVGVADLADARELRHSANALDHIADCRTPLTILKAGKRTRPTASRLKSSRLSPHNGDGHRTSILLLATKFRTT